MAALNASDVGDGSGFRHLYEISLDEHVIKGFAGEEWRPSMLDLELHALLGRDVFVTADPELLAPIGSSDLKSHRERLLNKTLVLRLAEAQRYVDLYLKEFRDYRVRPNVSMGQSGYYVKRLRDAIPAFSQAWSYMVFGKEALPRGRYLEEFMNTLSHRLTWQMRAHDRIGWLRYSPSNNAVVDEMVYHLNYFIMLTTGVFDCLAWLAYHRFQLKADKRSVSLRDLPTSRKQQRFLDIIANSAPSLADYLRTPYVQNRLSLFYGPRDSIQHRLLLTGIKYMTREPLENCTVAGLDNDMARAIRVVDPPTMSGAHFLPGDYGRLNYLFPALGNRCWSRTCRLISIHAEGARNSSLILSAIPC